MKRQPRVAVPLATLLALLTGLLIGACATTSAGVTPELPTVVATSAPTTAAARAPSVTAQPTVAPSASPIPTSAPTAAPTEVLPTIEAIPPTAAPAPSGAEAEIVAVVQQQLPQGIISVTCIEGDFAEAISMPPPDVASHGVALYLQRSGGAWTIVASGLGIFQEDLNGMGFPENFCNVPPRG